EEGAQERGQGRRRLLRSPDPRFLGRAGHRRRCRRDHRHVGGLDAVNLEPAVKETEDFDAAIQGMTKSAQAAKTNLNLLFEPEGGEGTLGSWADFGVDEINGVSDAMELMADRTSGAKGSLNELDSEFYTLFGAFGDTAWDTVRKQLEGMDDSLAGLVSTDFESAA